MAQHGSEIMLQRGCVLVINTEIMFVPYYEDCALLYELCQYLSNFGYTLYDVYNYVEQAMASYATETQFSQAISAERGH